MHSISIINYTHALLSAFEVPNKKDAQFLHIVYTPYSDESP